MRRPAKPFAVEVRKSKKPGDRDILGRSNTQAANEPAHKPDFLDIDRVFARFAPSAPVETPAMQAAADLFKPAVPERAAASAARILPDLTPAPVKAADAVVEAIVETRPRKPMVRKPKAAAPPVDDEPIVIAMPVRQARKPAARPAPLVLPADDAEDEAPRPVAKTAAKRILVRRRVRAADADLRPGERWKRRLPKAAR